MTRRGVLADVAHLYLRGPICDRLRFAAWAARMDPDELVGHLVDLYLGFAFLPSPVVAQVAAARAVVPSAAPHSAVVALASSPPDVTTPPRDRITEVPIHARYLGQTVDAVYNPITEAVTLRSPGVGGTFATPSASAEHVVRSLNPTCPTPRRDGWRFWKITPTGTPLLALRTAAP